MASPDRAARPLFVRSVWEKIINSERSGQWQPGPSAPEQDLTTPLLSRMSDCSVCVNTEPLPVRWSPPVQVLFFYFSLWLPFVENCLASPLERNRDRVKCSASLPSKPDLETCPARLLMVSHLSSFTPLEPSYITGTSLQPIDASHQGHHTEWHSQNRDALLTLRFATQTKEMSYVWAMSFSLSAQTTTWWLL